MSYRAVVVADAPISYWRLGETGATATDEMAANNGTYQGSLTKQVPGLIWDSDLAALGTGTATDYVLCKSGRILQGLANFSIEAWVQTSVAAANDMCIYGERAAAGNDILKMGMLGSSKVLEMVYRDDAGTLNRPNIAGAINDGRRHHCVVTKSGTSVVVYKDNVGSPTTLTATDTFTNASTECRIFHDLGGGASAEFLGTIDEVAIYNFALTPAQVALHYFTGSATPPAPAVHLPFMR